MASFKPIQTTAGASMGGMLALRLLAQGMVFASVMLLSRLLGPDEFGRYTYLFSGFLLFINLVNVQGLNEILVREMAADPLNREQIYRTGIALKGLSGIAALLIAAVVIAINPIAGLPRWVGWTAALTLLVSFSNSSTRMVWDVPYQVDFRMIFASLLNLGAKALFLFLLTVWWIADLEPVRWLVSGVTFVVMLQIGTEVLGAAAQAALNRFYGYPMLPRWDGAIVRRLASAAAPLALAGGLLMVLSKGGVLWLQWMHTPREVGIYGAPMRLVDALLIFPTVFTTGLLPILARTLNASKEGYFSLVRISFKMMVLVAVLAAAVTSVWAAELVEVVYGDKFVPAARVIRVLVWSAPLAFGLLVLHATAVAKGAQSRLTAAYTIQAGVGFGINAILIWKGGASGAAWGQVMGFGLLPPLGLAFQALRKETAIWLKSLPGPTMAAVLTAIMLKKIGIGLWGGALLTPIISAAFIYLIGWVTVGDYRALITVLKTKGVTPE